MFDLNEIVDLLTDYTDIDAELAEYYRPVQGGAE